MRKESVKTALVLVNYVSILEKWWKVCVCAKRLTNKRRKRVARCHCRCGCGITNIAIFTFLFVCDSCVAPLHSPLHTALERLQWKINILPSHLITSSRSILSFINDTIFYLFNRIRRCSLHTISCICLVNAKRGTSSLYLSFALEHCQREIAFAHTHTVWQRECPKQWASQSATKHSLTANCKTLSAIRFTDCRWFSIYFCRSSLPCRLLFIATLRTTCWFQQPTSFDSQLDEYLIFRGELWLFFYSCLFAYRARPDFLIFHRTVQCAQMVTPLGHISYYWIQEKW